MQQTNHDKIDEIQLKMTELTANFGPNKNAWSEEQQNTYNKLEDEMGSYIVPLEDK